MRRGLVAALTTVALAACQPAAPSPSSGGPDAQAIRSVLACGYDWMVARLAEVGGRVGSAARLFDLLNGFSSLEEMRTYMQSRNPAVMSPEEWADLGLLTIGLDACAETSPGLREAARGIAGAITPLTVTADPTTLGPALCSGIDPFGPPAAFRFQPRCEPSLAGNYEFTKRVVDCAGLEIEGESCGDRLGETATVTATIDACTATTCRYTSRRSGFTFTLSSSNGTVWQGSGTLPREAEFECYGEPRATTFAITATVAGELVSFSEVDTAPAESADCPAASLTWTATAARP